MNADARDTIRPGRPNKGMAAALGNHVVEVADTLFLEQGYSVTSMATVAQRARVGKQTLYRRFPDKAALFREVIRRRIEVMIPALTSTRPSVDPMAELKGLGKAALTTVLDADFVRLYRILIAEAVPFPELACAASESWGSNFAERCIACIGQAQASGACRPGDPKKLADTFLWALIGEAFLKGLVGQAQFKSRRDQTDHVDRVWQIFVRGVAPEWK